MIHPRRQRQRAHLYVFSTGVQSCITQRVEPQQPGGDIKLGDLHSYERVQRGLDYAVEE